MTYEIDVSAPLHTVAETASYLRDASYAGLTEPERDAIVSTVSADPAGGDEVVGSGGVRKVRIGGRGKGKSGGYRVMVAYTGGNAPAYLLALLSKGDRGDFSRVEIGAMKAVTEAIKARWRRRR